ncbi:MAG: hypothetical protein ACR2H7_06520 [Actinomycetota bacterium]
MARSKTLSVGLETTDPTAEGFVIRLEAHRSADEPHVLVVIE